MVSHKLRQTLIYLYELLESANIKKDATDCLNDTENFYASMDTIEYLTHAINELEKIK